MQTGTRPTIVVGVSGSRASEEALRWAADEARRRDADVRAVLCWSAESRAYYAPPHGPQENGSHEHARRLAATLREILGGDEPPGLTTEVVEGTAERALIARSAGADLLVLGSTSSALAGGAVGPVVRACLYRAHCPVVVIGPSGDGHQDLPSHRGRQPHQRLATAS